MSLSFTALGWIIVPITLILAAFARGYLLGWVAFTAVFQAAAVFVVNINGNYPIAIQPGFFTMSVACVALVLLHHRHGEDWPSSRSLHWIYWMFGIFAAYAVFSSYIIPHYLAGQLYVYPPRAGLDIAHAEPLQFSGTNVTQDLYVCLSGAFFLIVSELVYSARDDSIWQRIIRGWLLGGIVASVVGLYQIMGQWLGLPFPRDFFYSNPDYAEGIQHFGSLERLSGTFTEPTVAAYFLSATAAYALWRVLYGRGSALVWMALVLSVSALMLTTSSTAYLTLLTIGVLIAASLAARAEFSPRQVVRVMILLALSLFGVGLLLAQSRTTFPVFQAAILNKSQSRSYTDRVASNAAAWQAVRQTYGVGVGWGSTRAPGLFFNLLANVGVAGTAVLLACVGAIVQLVWRARRRLQGEMKVEMEAVLMAAAAMACAGVIAQPDLAQIPLWLALALLAGLGARTQIAQL